MTAPTRPKLTEVQWEVVRKMAAGGQCRNSDISGAYCGDRSVRPATIESLYRQGVIEPCSEYTWGTFYKLTPLGIALSKGDA